LPDKRSVSPDVESSRNRNGVFCRSRIYRGQKETDPIGGVIV
jgi:hypothetical protein